MVILEVGLGGRLDATNVVRSPAVCGIASLGFDHMEVLSCKSPSGVAAFSKPKQADGCECAWFVDDRI